MSTAIVAPVKPRKRENVTEITKPAAHSKLGRAQRAIELERLEKERIAEANKAPRFSAQHKFVLVALLTLTGCAAAMTFATSAACFAGVIRNTLLRYSPCG